MCCFAGSVESVSDTRIFARLDDGEQVLVYAMSLETRLDNAMVLPVPAAHHNGEAGLRFINLERYPDFFTDMAALFPVMHSYDEVLEDALLASFLEVESVGAFEASFVPSIRDFVRLDPRFRLPEGVWKKLPQYKDYAFAVFQLKKGRFDVHPMAFRFRTSLPGVLFFPTVHVHDGMVHPKARFDHTLYAQKAEGMRWKRSEALPKEKMAISRDGADLTQGLVVGDLPVYRRILMGYLPNRDMLLPGWEPEPSESAL